VDMSDICDDVSDLRRVSSVCQTQARSWLSNAEVGELQNDKFGSANKTNMKSINRDAKDHCNSLDE
jgi:hypothetical protein